METDLPTSDKKTFDACDHDAAANSSPSSALSKNRDFVTVDTEFIRETTFWPELCLIQMAAPGVTALIDPLAQDIDLTPFFELMANEAVIKVFHAARQDIEIIFHLGELIPHPVFDTQVAAMVCGFGDSVSYDQLVQKITGAQLDKSSRFTDWRRRPLSDKQLDYALADVTHLRDVYLHLKAELERENRAHWLTEEMEVLTVPRNLRSASGRRLEAAEDAAEQAAGTRHRCRRSPPGASARRASATCRAGASSRMTRSTRSPSSSRATPKRCRACAPCRRVGSARRRRPRCSTAVNAALDMPKDSMPQLPRHAEQRRKARAPPPNCSRCC